MIAGSSLLALVISGWVYALMYAPADAQQGEVYKIIFVHVPAAASALAVASIGLLIYSIKALIKGREEDLIAQRAWVEIGLLFTILTLATGSIWGKPTWGTWWTWDARLTTTFLLALLFSGYLLLHESLPMGKNRLKVCSILGILIFVDVPIIYKSVAWWRTLHQPASLVESRGSTMDPEMLSILLSCLAFTIIFSLMLWMLRRGNLALQLKLEQESLKQLRP